MRRTLLLIPHEIAGLPVFGWGWLLGVLLLAAAIISLVLVRRRASLGQYWSHNGLLWAILAAAIVFGLPRVELSNLQGDPVGLPIRGYGVMLLAGIVAAVWLAMVRVKRYGFDPDVVLSLAPWAVVGGILGARLFYVIEYRDHFFYGDLISSLRRVLNFTEGGLVVYGSFIGGFIGGAIQARRLKLPFWRLGDAIIPTLFLGLALGRLGCLMNGCCYGGACDDHWTALRFPNGSPVFQDQLADGRLLGIRFAADGAASHPAAGGAAAERLASDGAAAGGSAAAIAVTDEGVVRGRVAAVAPGSPADRQGVRSGDRIERLQAVRSTELASADRPAEEIPFGAIAVVNGVEHYWSARDLPAVAGPVLPAQIIGSISGLLLCLGLCWLSRRDHRDGTILLAGFAGYALLRFGIEILRSDEPGQFGTQLTISQWVSLVVLAGSLAAWWWLRSRPAATTARPQNLG